ncbi:MAG: zinc ABC transporter substrate-binding protein [Rhodospirillaceae bacterium]|nr:zinc ABC transporter substrate-binding protein [Rhodospirillales bacterium]
MWKRWAVFRSGIWALTILASPAYAEAPKVIASIQPLHSLVASVMQGVGEPGLLVTGAQSEHTYALKPSDARALQSARMVVLVDEAYETFLAKPLKGSKADIIALADLPGAVTLPTRKGGVWEPGHGDEESHDHQHAIDGHLWLDPANARLLVTAVADRLAEIDPAHGDTYHANATATVARLEALDAQIKAKLAPVAGMPFVVFHDAYHYVEKRYGLTSAGSITVDPDRPPSAKRLAALRDHLKATGAACVFREPQFPAPILQTLADSAGARVGVLDPQGADIPPGPEQYFTLMTRLADGLASCLAAK